MLFRLPAGAGRFVQLEGAAAPNGVDRCRLDESNADGGPVCTGVLGGTLGGRLGTFDVPPELDDLDALVPRTNGCRPRALGKVRSSLSPSSLASCGESSGLSPELCLGNGGCSDDWLLPGDSRGLFLVRSAMNWRSTWGVTSMPGLLASSARSICISESVRRSTSLYRSENSRMTSGSASAGMMGSWAWLRRDSGCVEKIWMRSCSMLWIESLFRPCIDYKAIIIMYDAAGTRQ